MAWAKKHFLALWVAAIVGFIYLAPNLFFIHSLGNDYRGIPMMKTPNEDFYLARIQEILDGHPSESSVFYYEYKDQPSFTPPVGEFFYAIPSFLLNTSPVNILIASRFYLPFILFLLIYFLIYKLTMPAIGLSHKVNAVAGALLVTLGYDLVDYRSLWLLMKGAIEPGGFLIWARPVRPILGVIFLLSFLLLIWPLIKGTERKKTYVIGASLALALMVPSSFFDWGMALSIMAVLMALYLLKKEYGVIKKLATVFFLAFAISTPYWFSVWRASQYQWYKASALRTGLFYTHYPLMNKLMLAVLGVYIALVSVSFFRREKSADSPANSLTRKIGAHLQNWHLFCLAFILGSLWAYNQQVITGRTIWPYHFVQYTIPLAMVVLMVLFYNSVKKESVYVWRLGVFIAISASLLFGIYTQVGAYERFYSRYANLQTYTSLFNWINQQEKDCVIFVANAPSGAPNLNIFIPAFTRCNIYGSNEIASYMPDERIYHNYFTQLFFSGIAADDIEEYVKEHREEALGYFASNWKSLYGVTDFPDFKDTKLEERIGSLPEKYKEFLSEGLKAELGKYRLDYILSSGPLNKQVARSFPNLEKVFEENNIIIYSFK